MTELTTRRNRPASGRVAAGEFIPLAESARQRNGGDWVPSLHAHYRHFNATTTHPPLDLASVLSASGAPPYAFSHRGPRFPGSLSEAGSESRSTLMPDATLAVSHLPQRLIPNATKPRFRRRPYAKTLRQWFLAFAFPTLT